MAIYLKENEIGYDSTLVGFPGLGSCMGVAIITTTGIFGFHSYGNNNTRGGTFGDYSRDHTHYGVVLQLYGSAVWDNRYAGKGKFGSWADEMKFIGNQLNYHGKVGGFDISNMTSGITTVVGESAYLEYRRDSLTHEVEIHYSKSADVDHQTDISPHTGVRVIKPDQQVTLPYKNKFISTATPKSGGSFSQAGDDGYFEFILP